MNFAIDTPNFGDFADLRLLAQFARAAEAAGWDGFFLWDHIGAGWPYPNRANGSQNSPPGATGRYTPTTRSRSSVNAVGTPSGVTAARPTVSSPPAETSS